MHYQVQKERKTHDAGVHLLLIDRFVEHYDSIDISCFQASFEDRQSMFSKAKA